MPLTLQILLLLLAVQPGRKKEEKKLQLMPGQRDRLSLSLFSVFLPRGRFLPDQFLSFLL